MPIPQVVDASVSPVPNRRLLLGGSASRSARLASYVARLLLPLALATGAASVARSTIGWTVLGGMLAATSLAIFIVPVLFVVITRLSYGKEKLAELKEQIPGLTE